LVDFGPLLCSEEIQAVSSAERGEERKKPKAFLLPTIIQKEINVISRIIITRGGLTVDKVTDSVINEMAAVVVREVKPEAIVLFGSYATGKNRPDSDVDLLIIKRAPFKRREEMLKCWDILSSYKVPKDILVYSPEEIKRWNSINSHVVTRALREGRLLYGNIQ
jgi:predicted nucleotidyltransferase